MFHSFLNTYVAEILDSKILYNVSLIKLVKYYYFELLVLTYLKFPGTQTPLIKIFGILRLGRGEQFIFSKRLQNYF